MANTVKGIFNGAMQFDENKLLPLYRLKTGSPGSSYTFSIAERIGLNKGLIDRAKKLVDENHYKLDILLNKSEQDLQEINAEKKQLNQLVYENELLKKEMQLLINKEKHAQEIEKLKLSNKISEEKIDYLKDMERKLKSLVIEWKKTENKNAVVKMMQSLLFAQKDKFRQEKQQQKSSETFEEITGEINIGSKVKMKQNRQTGIVKELRGKKVLLQVGIMPMLVNIKDLILIKERVTDSTK